LLSLGQTSLLLGADAAHDCLRRDEPGGDGLPDRNGGVEKQWSHGAGLAKIVGLTLLSLAAVVIFFPGIAPGLQAGEMATMGTMGS